MSDTLMDGKRNARGETPLHVACAKGKTEDVKTLLKAGANPNTFDHIKYTPLQEAMNRGHLEICELLLEAGAKANIPGQKYRTALHEAAANDDLAGATLMLRYGANKMAYDEYNSPPMEYAKSDEMRSLLSNETKPEKSIQEDQSIVVPNAKIVEKPAPKVSERQKVFWGGGKKKELEFGSATTTQSSEIRTPSTEKPKRRRQRRAETQANKTTGPPRNSAQSDVDSGASSKAGQAEGSTGKKSWEGWGVVGWGDLDIDGNGK